MPSQHGMSSFMEATVRTQTTRPRARTRRAARLTLWFGILALGPAGCTLQLPESMIEDPAPVSAPPTPLNFAIPTGDNADRVQVVSTAGYNPGGATVMLCLELVGITWWKGLGVGRSEPTLEVQDSKTYDCTHVDPEPISITFWKAKMFGVHTRLAGATLNLEGYAGHRVSLRWMAD